MLRANGGVNMKKSLFFLLLAVFASSCLAAEFKSDLKIRTGDSSLDLHFNNVNSKTATPAGANEVRMELRDKYSVPDKELIFLSKKGYSLAEIQYLALLAKQSGKPINSVAALHSQGIGWGVLAKRLGVQPSALRKLIVSQKKAEKQIIKQERKEKMMIKEQKIEPPLFRMNVPPEHPPRQSGFGPGRGTGKGKGH